MVMLNALLLLAIGNWLVVILAMKKIVYEKTIPLRDGKLYSINAKAGQGCYLEIIEQTKAQLDAMLSYHRKVFVCMLIFHLHDYTADNLLFSKFMRKFNKRLKLSFKFKRIGYVWVRECGTREAQHYHLALFLDGSLVQFPQGVLNLAADIWEGWNQPHPAYPPKKSYYMLRRGAGANFQAVLRHLSYFAKTRTKGDKGKAANDYSASRLRCRPIPIDRTTQEDAP